MSLDLFITCSESLEPLLLQELVNMGYAEAKLGFRGVTIPYSMKAIYEVNYLSRLAGRVLLPLAAFPCKDAKELYEKSKTIDWLKYLKPNTTSFAIDFNGKHRAFHHTFYAAQVLKDAICDYCREKTGSRPNVNVHAPDVQLNLYLQNDRVIISLDTSGEPLFKRGYRKESVAAPLQESLAAALLIIAGYQGNEILLDPCCGSATLLIESALMASSTPPGFLRKKWGFFHLPEFSQEEFAAIQKEHLSRRKPLKRDMLIGYEINSDSARIALASIRNAGFQDEIQIIREDFQRCTPTPFPNLVVCNPPHGRRLGSDESLKPLYRALGDFFKQKMQKPSRAFVYTTNLNLAKEVGLKPSKRHIIKSSGEEGRLLEFDIF